MTHKDKQIETLLKKIEDLESRVKVLETMDKNFFNPLPLIIPDPNLNDAPPWLNPPWPLPSIYC